jgi:hypothetical protein
LILGLCPRELLEERHPLVKRIAGGVAEEVLQQERHAAKRTLRKRLGGGRDRLLRQVGDDRAQLRVQRLHAADGPLDQLAGGELTLSHELSLSRRIKPRKL